MPEIKRKPNETFEFFFRRFTKAIQQSGKIIQSRKIKFLEKDRSKNEQKKSALRKKKIQKEQEYLKKIGKFEDKKRFFKK